MDVLCRILPAGIANATDAITVPVEVKLSHNPEARTGLRDQLGSRYMTELGAGYGVFIVAWLGTPTSRSSYRPIWNSLSDARECLERLASDVSATMGGFCIRAVVVNASLPTMKKPKKNSKKGPTGRKKSATLKGTDKGKKAKGKAKKERT